MAHSQFALLGSKRFLPLFVTQFFGAFHDNVFKNALVALLIYGVATTAAANDTKILVTMAAAIFILPFILFSALGGQLADKFSKHRIIRSIKFAEIAISCLGALALLSGSIELSFVTLFALGTQSAFFGPSKYAILPDHLEEDELIAGNALLNTGTFFIRLVRNNRGNGTHYYECRYFYRVGIVNRIGDIRIYRQPFHTANHTEGG